MPTRTTIQKINIEKFDESTDYDQQFCGLKLSLIEEVTNQDGEFLFTREKPSVKMRNFFAHNDLMEKFEKLRSHMVEICEFDKENEGTVFVTGVTYTGTLESEGFVLTGFKVLKSGKKLNIVTPNIGLADQDGTELLDILTELENEAIEAYSNKKRKEFQRELFDDQEADGGSDDESDVLGDPILSFKKTVNNLKKEGVTLSVSAN